MSKELTTLEQVLVDTIKSATEGAKEVTAQAIDFASEQIPDIVHQLLMYKMAVSIFFIVASLVGLGVMWVACKKIYADCKKKQQSEKCFDEIVHYMALTFIPAGIGIPSLIALTKYTLLALKIWLAPKIFLLEYVAELIK